MSLFELRGRLTKQQNFILGIIGFLLLLLIWWGLAEYFSDYRKNVETMTHPPSMFDTTTTHINRDSLFRLDSIRYANATDSTKIYPILPPPMRVLKSFPSLLMGEKYKTDGTTRWKRIKGSVSAFISAPKGSLIIDAKRSIWLNLRGYFWAIFISIPLGFIVGLFPLFRGLFSKQVDAMRYLPLTAVTGLFITWFGIDDVMKVSFLAFGIIVYLLPVVVQRIDEVKDVYLKTVFTLGANNWQTIKTVYFPSVLSKLMDDIRVLTAISWTYIIIAELINRQGGLGARIYLMARQGHLEKVFAILIVIIIIGFLQDRLFIYLDKRLFPFKYIKKSDSRSLEANYGIYLILGIFALAVLLPVLLGSSPGWLGSIGTVGFISGIIMIIYGEFKNYSKKSEE